MNKIKIIFKYLKYRFISKTKYDIHSPFVYNLVTKCINNKEKHVEYLEIEKLRKELLNNNKTVEIQDFGAGSLMSSSKTRTISQIANNSAKTEKYAQLLFRLVKYFQPNHILELGTSLGISASYMAKAAPFANVITIEGSENIAEIAKQNFKKLNIRNITQITADFNQILDEVLANNPKSDFIFIDGNHRKEPTLSYFRKCLNYSNSDTVFVFDDIHWSLEMEDAWEEIKKTKEVKLSIDLFFMGLVFLRKESVKQDFIIKF